MLCFSRRSARGFEIWRITMVLDIVVFIAVVVVASILAYRGKLLTAVGIFLLGAAVLALGP